MLAKRSWTAIQSTSLKHVFTLAVHAFLAYGGRSRGRSPNHGFSGNCQDVNDHIVKAGVQLGRHPEFAHLPTFSASRKCAYNIHTKGEEVEKKPRRTFSMTGEHLNIFCTKSNPTTATCTATGFGNAETALPLPDCASMPAVLTIPNSDEWATVGEQKDFCSINGFIEEFRPLHRFGSIAGSQRGEEKRSMLLPELQTGAAFYAVREFVWRVREKMMKEEMELNENTLEDTWKSCGIVTEIHSEQVMNFAVREVLSEVADATPSERNDKLRNLAWRILALHVGPTPQDKRMTREQCRAAMTLFDCADHYQFIMGDRVSTWDNVGAQPPEMDNCKCSRTRT